MLQRVEERGICYSKTGERLTGLGTSCVGTACFSVTGGKVEGRAEMTGRRGRRRMQLLDDLKEKRE
jgi:hypothetical protein